jgi:4-hydroxy-3-polyprenylbenzoate decarboxylase
LPEEGYHRGWPEPCVLDEATEELVTRRWSEYGL